MKEVHDHLIVVASRSHLSPETESYIADLKKKMLDEYLVLLEEAKKRDHRKIGKEMQLFMFSETVGKGLPMWLPKGPLAGAHHDAWALRAHYR